MTYAHNLKQHQPLGHKTFLTYNYKVYIYHTLLDLEIFFVSLLQQLLYNPSISTKFVRLIETSLSLVLSYSLLTFKQNIC
jgi:hypothetical protein